MYFIVRVRYYNHTELIVFVDFYCLGGVMFDVSLACCARSVALCFFSRVRIVRFYSMLSCVEG